MRCCRRRKRNGSGRTEKGGALVAAAWWHSRSSSGLRGGYPNNRSHRKSTNTRSFGDNCRLDGHTIENCPGAIR